VQSKLQSAYLVVGRDKLAEPVGTGTAAVDSLVVHTAAAGTVVAGKMAEAGHTVAEQDTVDGENNCEAAVVVVDNQPLGVEDKSVEAGGKQTVLD